MNRIYFLILVSFFLSCSTDQIIDDTTLSDTLASTVADKKIKIDNVIACAASNENNALVSVFLYPRPGVTNIQYYETATSVQDKNDYKNYTRGNASTVPVFNGFLLKFEIAVSKEKWVVVTFDEDGETHLSNPIRIKNLTKPTEYIAQNVTIDAATNMPIFSWIDGLYDDTKIYFEVVSDVEDNFISGTYTFEKMFRYYKLDNVVLNITPDNPPLLKNNETYNFSLLAVSEDNWVNLFSEVEFEIPVSN